MATETPYNVHLKSLRQATSDSQGRAAMAGGRSACWSAIRTGGTRKLDEARLLVVRTRNLDGGDA
jgi:hypothetical protein